MSEKEYVQLSEKDLRKLLQKSGLARHADDFVQRRNAYVVAERTRVLTRFEAHQKCPQCQVYGFHLMKPGIHYWNSGGAIVIRKCNDCGYEWRQE